MENKIGKRSFDADVIIIILGVSMWLTYGIND